MKVQDLLTQTARVFPDRIAISHEDRQLTFARLDKASDQIASHIRTLNINAGERAAILFENGIDYSILFFVTLKAGLVAVPLDTSLGGDSLSKILADCNACLLFTQAKFRRKIPEI